MNGIQIKFNQCKGKTVRGATDNSDMFLIVFTDGTYICQEVATEYDCTSIEDATLTPTSFPEAELIELGICEIGEVDRYNKQKQEEYLEHQRLHRLAEFEKLKKEFGSPS